MEEEAVGCGGESVRTGVTCCRTVGGTHKGLFESLLLQSHDERITHAAEHLHIEDLRHRALELDPSQDNTRSEIDRPDATLQRLVAFGQRKAAERRRLTNLRQADEADLTDQLPARVDNRGIEPRRLAWPDARSTLSSSPRPELSSQQSAVMPARRVGHAQPAEDDVATADIHHTPARQLVLPPTRRFVRGRQQGHVSGLALPHGDAIEVTTIATGKLRDEWWLPTRHKTVAVIQRTQTREERVDDPQIPGSVVRANCAIPGDLVALYVAGHVRPTRQVARVAGMACRKGGGKLWLILQKPDVGPSPDGEPAAGKGQTHGLVEGPRQHRQSTLTRPKDHQLARLIGRDPQRHVQPVQQVRHLGRMRVAQWTFVAASRTRSRLPLQPT